VSFAAIALCVASQRVFYCCKLIHLYESVRKLLDTPSYTVECNTVVNNGLRGMRNEGVVSQHLAGSTEEEQEIPQDNWPKY
jgi:hypothetical protein